MQKLEFHIDQRIMKMYEQSIPGTIVCGVFVPEVLYIRLLSHPTYTSAFQLIVYSSYMSFKSIVLDILLFLR